MKLCFHDTRSDLRYTVSSNIKCLSRNNENRNLHDKGVIWWVWIVILTLDDEDGGKSRLLLKVNADKLDDDVPSLFSRLLFEDNKNV